MKKNTIAVLLSILLILSMAGLPACTSQPQQEEPPEVPEQPALEQYQASLYFVNEDYIVTGDETLDRLMPPEAVTVEAAPDMMEEAVLEALKTVPDKEGYGTMVTPEMTFNDVYVEGNTAFVDISRENLSGSSTQEGFLISQIVSTLKASVPGVEQVQFLVDGEIAESLMGHIDATKPFTE